MNKSLSPFPYYGGKAKMASFICSQLDYDFSDIYIEPYGGAGRVLLNKRKHDVEIYNEFGYGMRTFMEIMTDKEKTEILIEKLLENPPDKESFRRLLIERMETEDPFGTEAGEALKLIAWESYKNTSQSIFARVRKAIRENDIKSIVECLEIIMCAQDKVLEPSEVSVYQYFYEFYSDLWNIVKDDYMDAYLKWKIGLKELWERHLGELNQQPERLQKFFRKRTDSFAHNVALNAIEDYYSDTVNANNADYDEIEIAFYIFQLYYSSRDGMGVVWSEEKNRNVETYYNAVRNLRKISERMQGVIITEVDALMLIAQYSSMENVIFYLDPSYLKPDDESKNLGEIYKRSYSYEDHKKLLEYITDSDVRAKIVISNYDVDLYNQYLGSWNKIEYKTHTGVGSKKNNERVEVLWKNF